MKYMYISKRPREQKMVLIAAALRILENFGIRMTVRQLFYQMVAADLIPNQVRWYKRVVDAVRDGRMIGVLDWDLIEDRLREPKEPAMWNDIDELIEIAKSQFRLDRWWNQDYYIEVWLEKDALAGIVADALEPWQVTLQVNRGYSSVTAMRNAALRFIRADGLGKMCVIGYLGDHDPSGEDMVRDIRDRLALFEAEGVLVKKIAIMREDIDRYNLPPQPVKTKDSRSTEFMIEHGDDCVELDALRPDVLQGRVTGFISEHLDEDKYNEVIEEEDRQRKAVVIGS